MLNDKDLINVTNRSDFLVVYKLEDLNIKRRFRPNETKKITVEEIKKLSYTRGGFNIIKKYLLIDSKELLVEIGVITEPEYFYSEKDIEELLLRGDMDKFLDCLDFAPSGVIDLIKTKAVELKLNDYSKREAIKNKTGCNITLMIENSGPDIVEDPTIKNSQRRVKVEEETKTPAAPERRYKIIDK